MAGSRRFPARSSVSASCSEDASGGRSWRRGHTGEGMLAETARGAAAIPPDQRPLVYYARGPKGLETAAAGSINVESLERLGARIAAPAGTSGGLAAVSLEQVLAWNPDVIIALESGFGGEARVDPRWRQGKAGRDGRVSVVPQFPFPSLHLPPS